ncbi:MAG: hypothetical protein FWD74_08340 [Actinomycetia bacterium]|nr:hypothetical protein [Actinomycetes bacterium]
MRQIITRMDDQLAERVKECAAADGISVNSLVITVLEDAVREQPVARAWKRQAVRRGLAQSGRPAPARTSAGLASPVRVEPADLGGPWLDAARERDRHE